MKLTQKFVLTYIADAEHYNSGRNIDFSPRFQAEVSRLPKGAFSFSSIDRLEAAATRAYRAALSASFNPYSTILERPEGIQATFHRLGLTQLSGTSLTDQALIYNRLRDLLSTDVIEHTGPRLFVASAQLGQVAVLVRCGPGVPTQLWQLDPAARMGARGSYWGLGVVVAPAAYDPQVLVPNFGVPEEDGALLFFRDLSDAIEHFGDCELSSPAANHILLSRDRYAVALHQHAMDPARPKGPQMWVAVPGNEHTAWSSNSFEDPSYHSPRLRIAPYHGTLQREL